MPTLQDEDYLSLPLSWFREVLCNDPPSHVFTAAVRSKTFQEDFSPRKVRIELGRLLCAKDPLQNFFVVFLFEDTKTAEVWLRREWDESLSKRFAQVTAATADRETYVLEKEKYDAISNWIELNMHIERTSYANEQLTTAFAKLKHIPQELECFTGLVELLNRYGNLQGQTTPSS